MRHPITLHARSAAQRRLFFWTQLWDTQSARDDTDATRFGDDTEHAAARAAVRARAPEDEENVPEPPYP